MPRIEVRIIPATIEDVERAIEEEKNAEKKTSKKVSKRGAKKTEE